MVNCDNAGKAIFALPATLATSKAQATKVVTLKVAWDTGAVTTTSPSTENLNSLEHLTGVFVRGVVGPLQPIKLKGLFFPKVSKPPHIPLAALHVPGSPYMLISISQFCKEYNAAALFDQNAGILWNKDGLLATATVVNGLYVQDDVLQNIDLSKLLRRLSAQFTVPNGASPPSFISCLSFSLETLRWIHLASNHLAYSTLRKIHNFPPADKDNPDPVCPACCASEMKRDNIPDHKLEKASRAWQDLTMDISRRKSPDHRGNQRAVIVCDRFSDFWDSLPIKRKSEAANKVLQYIDRLNNRNAPNRVSSVTTDGELHMSHDFREQLKQRGIHLIISAPHEQWQNPAESTMKRWQKAVFASMHQAHAPPGSWSFCSSHVCYVHNRIALPGMMSPAEIATGIRPTWEPEKVFMQKCSGRLYNAGKEETKAVDCTFMGFDEHCNADIVRPLDPSLASSRERYCKVTKHYRGEFPMSHPHVPRPAEKAIVHYESDTDDDALVADNTVPIPYFAQDQSMLAKGLDYDYDNKHTSDDDVVNYDEPENNPYAGVSVAPRTSSRVKTMSNIGAASAASKSDTYYFTANILQSIVTSARDPVPSIHDEAMKLFEASEVKSFNIYLAEQRSNPFADLFDPKTMSQWKDPKTVKEMMAHPMRDHFLEAREKEKEGWVRNKAYTVVKKSDVPIDPATGKQYVIMRYHEVWKTKWNPNQTIEKFKNRVTANGKYQNKDVELCYESMVTIPSIRVGFDLAVRFGLQVAHTDAMEFYLQHEVRDGEAYYMEIPDGWTSEDQETHCLHLHKAAYGIPSAGQTAGHKLTEYLGEIGLKPCPHDNKFYVNWVTDTEVVMCMSHSDDIMWFGTSQELIDKFINLLRNKVPMTPTTYSPSIFRGIEIIYHKNGDITLHQAAYIKEFIKKFNLENRKTPIVPGRELDQSFQPTAVFQASKKIIKEYMVRQGCLQWASLCSPSCAYVINWLARYMQNPQHHHIKQQESCLLYMVSIADKGITYVRQGPVQQFRKGFNMDCLLGYGDATWADRADNIDARSTTGLLWETDQGTLLWYTGKQNNVTLSSCESEVMANKTTCQQGVWLRGLYGDLGGTFTKPSNIMQDNTGAIAMAKTDANHSRSRHYRIACAYIRECYNRRIFGFVWVQTSDMKADILTKPITQPAHAKHEQGMTRHCAKRVA